MATKKAIPPAVPTQAVQQQDQPPGKYKVVLTEVGANKIDVIKAVREVTSLGLKEAKDLVDDAPKIALFYDLDKDKAASAKKRIEEAGAKVDVIMTRNAPSAVPKQVVPAPSPNTRAKRLPGPEKYTLKDAFDYFNIPEAEGLPGPETSDLNNERCVRALAFLLHYCSEFGNENVDG